MWPPPETRPTVIPVFLDTLYDFKMLERAAQNTQKFAITAYQMNVITGGVFPYNLMTYDLPEVGGTRPRPHRHSTIALHIFRQIPSAEYLNFSVGSLRSC